MFVLSSEQAEGEQSSTVCSQQFLLLKNQVLGTM